jgi:hypothetical protein
MTARKAKGHAIPQRCGGFFTADPDVPADPITGQEYCRCGLAGRAGDAHHAMPDGPPEDARSRAAGEKED